MSKELTIPEIKDLSVTFARSAMFPDIKSEQQAMVKIIAGNELGLPPFASMSGLHIINGKVVMGGNLIATLIKSDPRYNYQFSKDENGKPIFTNDACSIDFFENGELVGVSTFSIADAKRVTVWKKNFQTGKKSPVPLTESNPNWKNYPRNMLFNRAISNGAKWFCAGVFGGSPVYTPDEMGQNTTGDGDMIIDVTPIENKPSPPRQPSRKAIVKPRQNRQSPPRPQQSKQKRVDTKTGEVLEGEVIDHAQEQFGREQMADEGATLPPEPRQPEVVDPLTSTAKVPAAIRHDRLMKQIHAMATKAYGGKDAWDKKRAELSASWGVKSSDEWTQDNAFGLFSELKQLTTKG